MPHKIETKPRNGGYLARCLDCDAITFGGFPSRTAARAALAGHDLSIADPIPDDLGSADPIAGVSGTHNSTNEEAPGAVRAAAEGNHPAPRNGNETMTSSIPDTTTTTQHFDLTGYALEVRGPRPEWDAPEWERDGDEWRRPLYNLVIFPDLRELRVTARHLDGLQSARRYGRECLRDGLTAEYVREPSLNNHGDRYWCYSVPESAPAVFCSRVGCNDEGTYPTPTSAGLADHLCTATSEADRRNGIEVFYDESVGHWLASIEDKTEGSAPTLRDLAGALEAAADRIDKLEAPASAAS